MLSFDTFTTMTSPAFVLYLACLLLGKISSSVRQESSFVPVKPGDKLTMQCFFGDVPARLYWFKQTLGHKPELICSYYKHEINAVFYDKFKNNPRFTMDTENGKYHLTITDLRISDSATYYCVNYKYSLEFSESIIVSVKGSGFEIPAWIIQSASESVQPGGSVTLNCTVHTGTCDGEHSVYWFKDSQESHPGLIYTHGGRNDQCERKPNTQTHTCVYNLPMKNLDVSHAGTYYCAVASCGHILFGNGTKLDFEVCTDEVDYFWSGALAFTNILVVLLAFTVCMMNWKNRWRSSESQARQSPPSTVNAEDYQNADNLYYAALSVDLCKRSSRQRDPTWSECVYYSMKK